MAGHRGFDEVMIVNPFDPARGNGKGVTAMRFQPGVPGMGYYSEPELGYFAQPPDFGYFAEDLPLGYYGEDPYGEDPFGEDPYGAYAEDLYSEDPYGYYAEDPYGEDPHGWYAEDPYGEDPYGEGSYGWYGQGYAEDPYGEDPYGWYAEDPYGEDPYGYYAEDPYAGVPEMVGYGNYAGYVRDAASPFNAGCPMPSNVSGLGEMEGYVKPGEVSPMCETFTPQPIGTTAVPETFRPLW